MPFGLTLESISTLALMLAILFVPFWVVLAMTLGRFSVINAKINLEELNDTTENKDRTAK